jgi:predicted dehydrogenase
VNRDESGPSIAIVGCGRWGRNIVRDLLELGCRVLAIDVSEAARRDAVGQGAAAAFRTLRGGTRAGQKVDGAIVAGPTKLHAMLASEALELGLPVFVEKPLTNDPSSAADLVTRGADRLFVMHKWHYHPGIEALADLAQSGDLGGISGVTSSRVGSANTSDTDMLWLLAPHEITIGARVLGGFPTAIEAFGESVDGELAGMEVCGQWDDGRWHHWSISARRGPVARRVVLDGARGQAVLPSPYAEHVELTVDGAPTRFVAIDQEPPLRRQLRVFRDHLLGGPPPPTSAADGLEVVRTIVAIRASAGLGEN